MSPFVLLQLVGPAVAEKLARLGLRGEAIERVMAAESTSREERGALVAQIQQIAAQSDTARAALGTKLLEIDIEHGKAIKRITDEYAQLDQQLIDLRGDADAAAKGFDLANERIFNRIRTEAASSNPIARERADRAATTYNFLREIADQQGRLTAATRDFGFVSDAVSTAQQRINIEVVSGQITANSSPP